MFEDQFNLQDSAQGSGFNTIIEVHEEQEDDPTLLHLNSAPLLALKNTVLFPSVVIPITIGRSKSQNAVHDAYNNNKLIGVVSQKSHTIDDPSQEDLFTVGTLARVVRIINMPDNTITAIIQGKARFKLNSIINDEPFLLGQITVLQSATREKDKIKLNATVSAIRDNAKTIIELSPQIPPEAIMMIKNIESDKFLVDFISSNMNASVSDKQEILEQNDLLRRATLLLKAMNSEIQMLEVKSQIENKVRGDIEKSQREFILNQQMRMIQEELGESPSQNEIEEFKARAEKKKWNDKVQKVFDKEIAKLERANPHMPDYSNTINYVETILELPWEHYTKDKIDLKKVQNKLDQDHFGLEEVKKRIVEHLAVLKLKGDMKSPIICLVGPPGVGKTSLGKSIADAIGRKFVRMSLGGLHDESEIRGHRRTYIGALPGRIIQGLKKSQTGNPVFILDEIDKLGKDFRGDPSSALLEVLDPEQNTTFYDNYLEMEYDLSKVMFIATANSLSQIQPALLDRMEIIDVSGYSVEEKVQIGAKHLIPKQREAHGLKSKNVSISNSTLKHVVQHYTRESGVRNLDRQIAGLMRYAAKEIAMNDLNKVTISAKSLEDILGPKKFTAEMYRKAKVPGIAVGLAWTRVGGDILFIEANKSKGKGKLTLTGNLGDVMKESATTALSFLKANAEQYSLDAELFEKTDIHIHVPEGAIPKDGPSAGITMLTALYSALSEKKTRTHVAMTGEITLRGAVLPVGGIKEKVLAANRAGIKEIILCSENERHIREIKEEYIKHLQIHYVDEMDEVLKLAIDKSL